MNRIDRPGRFRADVTVLGLVPAKDAASQSVAVAFDFSIVEMWDEDTASWAPWSEYAQTIAGLPNLIKKNGEPNAFTVDTLIKSLGWDGKVENLVEGSPWKPTPCQITVAEDTYEGHTKLKVDWINPWDSEGGTGLKVADPATVKTLAAMHGAKIRAIAGNILRNQPKVAAVQAPPPQADADTFDPNKDDEIPFDREALVLRAASAYIKAGADVKAAARKNFGFANSLSFSTWTGDSLRDLINALS
mgnify:CR=1 FL=1